MVTKQNPQLKDSQGSDPSNREEPNPLNAECDTKTETSVNKPEPPAWGESLGWALLMLVGEGVECKSGETCSANQRGVEQDKTSLGEQAVL